MGPGDAGPRRGQSSTLPSLGSGEEGWPASRGGGVRRGPGPRVEPRQGDLPVPDSLLPAVRGARVVVHCARWNGSPPTREAARAIDITGTGNLLAACLHAGVQRVVHLSSVAVYGPTRRALITEETPFWPADASGQSKG